MTVVMTQQQVQIAMDHLTALQAMYDEKLREQRAEHQLILARITEQKRAEKEAAISEMPVEPYLFPGAKCSHCGHNYVQLKTRRKRLHINDTTFIKPRTDLSGAILCPTCRKELIGVRGRDHRWTPTRLEQQLENDLLENPNKYPMFAPAAEDSTPILNEGLHAAQVQNDVYAKSQRHADSVARQAALKDRLMRRITQKVELIDWCSKHKNDTFASIGRMFMEAARVCILDGTDEKQARRDRAAAVRDLCESFKVECPLPKKPPIKRRHGHQHTWKKALPGSSESGPATPTELVAHVGDNHATSTVFHSEVIEPTKKVVKAKGDSIRTFEYVAPTRTQAEAATQTSNAVQALYRAPIARSLETELGEDVDYACAADMNRPVRELLAMHGLTHYADEGVKMYPLTFRGETNILFVTSSVERQIYVAVYNDVLGWGELEEAEGAQQFVMKVRKGNAKDAVCTFSATDLTAYTPELRGEFVSIVDMFFNLLNKEAE